MQPRPVVEGKINNDEATGRQFLVDALARFDVTGRDQLHGEVMQAGIVTDDDQQTALVVVSRMRSIRVSGTAL